MIPPNEQVAKERKKTKHSEEQEIIGKQNVLGYQSQKETLDPTLYVIPPNEKLVEEIKYTILIITKGPSKDKPNKLFPKVALMDKSYAQGTKVLKNPPKIRTFSDPALLTRQETMISNPQSPEKELKEKDHSQQNISLGKVPGNKNLKNNTPSPLTDTTTAHYLKMVNHNVTQSRLSLTTILR